MRVQQLKGTIPLAGSVECPSTQRRLRCPKCYALLPAYLWKGTNAECPHCGFKMRVIDDGPRFWNYFLKNWRVKGALWGLFYAFVWCPVQVFDHYLRLNRLLYFAVLRLMS